METAKRLEAARRALARAEESVGLSSAPSGAGARRGSGRCPTPYPGSSPAAYRVA